MKILPAVLVLALCAAPSPAALASAPPEAQAVLKQEQRWVQAAHAHDQRALAQILAPNFVHVNYQGKLFYREAALAAIMGPRLYTEHTGEQTVDFAGNTAVVHGVNTIMQGGAVVLRLRYTDVYVKQQGQWKALSAQETAISPSGTR